MQPPNRRPNNSLGDSNTEDDILDDVPTGSDAGERNHSPSVRANGQVFRDNSNRPINFFLHGSVEKADTIRKLTSDIVQHGGRVVNDLQSALIVLVSRSFKMKEVLQSSYETSPDQNMHKIYVKRTPFVIKCIQNNQMILQPNEIKPMRGCFPGRSRVDFTHEDDERLCHYLALTVPEKDAGGRFGDKVYIQLVEQGKANPELFDWTGRHTFQSWKERYKKNQKRMDPIIEKLAERLQPTQKQLWKEDRRLNKRMIQDLEISRGDEESDDEEGGDGDGDEVVQQQYQAPLSKRARIAPRQESPNTRWKAKGKERAIDVVDLETATLHTFDVNEEEPEPSGRTLVPANTQQGSSSSNLLTQTTLVPSSQNERLDPYGLPRPTAWSSPPRIPAEAPPTLVNDIPTRSAPPLIVSPSNRAPASANNDSDAVPEPRPLSFPTESTNTAYQRPRMAARRPKNFRREVDASEQSEPPQPPTPSRQAKKTTQEEIVDDSEAEHQSSVASHIRGLSLEDDNENHNVNQDVEGGGRREASMDSDDAQTKQNLSGATKPSNSLDTTPSEFLQRLETQSTVFQRSSRLSLRGGRSIRLSQTPRPSLQTPNRALVTSSPWITPSDTSSVESYPPSNTKASARKKELQQNEKNTPYKPPENTRAARLAQRP